MEIKQYDELTFENIKHIDENGIEFWYARELQQVLDYSQWRRFEETIERAKLASKNTGNPIEEHFADVGKTLPMPNGAERTISDYKLSRYACYLIVQNGDPRKEVIALGQSYFAIKTRQQELQDDFDRLSEDQKRIAIRDEIKRHNKSLSQAASNAGVTNFGEFHNYGYLGLYGMNMKEIHDKKELEDNEHILDYMGSVELAANLFRATQTDEKLRREKISGAENANRTHFAVGRTVRQTMRELGNTMPENLPTPRESIKDLKKKQKNIETNDNQLSLFDDI
ncbi:DNA damage-inducible protein D [Streptococcus uberis Ab71]|uniref:DNA damage-inducible protein D n=1 Tax=Streptococcus uberis TaxID=1349 RepID=UPI0006203B38|nr:DNA damage-inducible protein D [Streptococcus uberis]KKF40509.1 DNA damage-inducible protein D [Streptococcus uberis Ab71]QBX11991.1 DNA-damage-inducible protein D [Streptococcus satellite phage Javan622]